MLTQTKGSTHPVHRLTPRESQILAEVVCGHSNKEIAEILSLSVKTIEWHRMNLMKKLDAHKVADLVRIALQERIV